MYRPLPRAVAAADFQMLGRFVDLKTWGFIHDRIRPRVERERQVQYAA